MSCVCFWGGGAFRWMLWMLWMVWDCVGVSGIACCVGRGHEGGKGRQAIEVRRHEPWPEHSIVLPLRTAWL